jgi:hypothetical protein
MSTILEASFCENEKELPSNLKAGIFGALGI